MKTRPRSFSDRDRAKISWMTCWPGPVCGMGLAGIDDLDRAVGVPEDRAQPVEVAEQEAGPLVRRKAPGEADRQDLRIERRLDVVENARRFAVASELHPQPAPGEDRQLQLLALVRLPELGRRDILEAVPERPDLALLVDVVEIRADRPTERVADGIARPRRHVDPVRDAPDAVRRNALPRRVGRLCVELADRICVVGQAQREARHVEHGRIALRPHAQREHVVDRHAAGLGTAVALEERSRDPPDEIRLEALIPGRYRRVDREDAVATDLLPGLVELVAGRDEFPGTLREQERRVALVEMPDGRLDSERPKRPDAADAQDELLVQPHLPASDVQDVRDRPVGVVVLGDVRVEQQHGRPSDLDAPDRDVQVALRQGDRDGQRLSVARLDATDRQVRRS